MKKTALSICIAILGSCIAMAQGTDVTVIGRIEQNPVNESGEWSSYWGNSSLFTFFEGGVFSERISYNLGFHWIQEGIQDLYTELGTNNSSALTNASLTYSGNIFSVTLGKIDLPIGGIEFDDYDAMIHYPLASVTWLEMIQFYLWGGSICISPWENTSFDFGLTSSPFVSDIFEAMGFSMKWTGEYGPVSTLWSIGKGNIANGEGINYAALGTSLDLGSSNLILDTYLFNEYKEAYLTYNRPLGEKFEFLVRGGFININDNTNLTIGGGIHWYPLTDDSLRIHAICSHNDLIGATELSIGATWNLGFHIGK